MFPTIRGFEEIWSYEIEATQKVLRHITTKSLTQGAGPDGRTLGRVAWHLTMTIPEMMSKTGLSFPGVDIEAPVPATANEIFKTYNTLSISLLDQIKQKWTDATLLEKDNMYGEMWTRGRTLTSLVFHQTHHRGQMTVLMRQAGIAVPGVYGPALEEWAQIGMKPPTV